MSLINLFILSLVIINVCASPGDTWKVKLDIPKLMYKLLDTDTFKMFRQRLSRTGNGDPHTIVIKLTAPDAHTILEALNQTPRRLYLKPGVEVGQGVFKTEQTEFHPDQFVNELKKLVRIKERNKKLKADY